VNDRPLRRIAIAGTGLIGSSIGLRARRWGAEVHGWDTSEAACAEALARGALDRRAPSFEALIEEADAIVLAAPLASTLDLLARLPAQAGALVVDTASLKAPVAAAGKRVRSFVPTHPMAGAERSGPSAARADLFEGAVWAYVPSEPAPTRAAAAFIEAMGARPMAVNAAAHDRAVGLTSHLPQLVAVALAQHLGERMDDDLVRALCGPGIRSMTRLAGSSWAMWESILASAGGAAAQEVRTLCDVLAQLAEELASPRSAELPARFAAANRVARDLDANDPGGVRVCESKSPVPPEVV
jgi:prephenate dehydrogenase